MKTLEEKIQYLMLLCMEKGFYFELNPMVFNLSIYRFNSKNEIILSLYSYYDGELTKFIDASNDRFTLDILIQKVEDYGI